MIPSDRIAIDGEKAWWLPHVPMMTAPSGKNFGDPTWVKRLDRQCDTCEGNQRWIDFDRPGQLIECGDCDGTGRHTFEVGVETELHAAWERSGKWYKHDHAACAITVSVVPGMVIKLRGHLGKCDDSPHAACTLEQGTPPTLPDAAKPGGWAVQLLIHDNQRETTP